MSAKNGAESAVSRARDCFRPVKDEDWKPFKAIITKLYWENNYTLQVVADTMRVEHGFYATYDNTHTSNIRQLLTVFLGSMHRRKQYVRRFEKWKLRKNVRSAHMHWISETQRRRRNTESKETCFYFRGRLVPQGKVDRWRRRRETCTRH